MTGATAHSVAVALDAVHLKAGPYEARVSADWDVQDRALALRRRAYGRDISSDADVFDALSLHGIVSDTHRATDRVAFRARLFFDSVAKSLSYTGLSYDMSPWRCISTPVLELGRVCQDPQHPDPAALRLAWAAIYQLITAHNVTHVIGCASLPGANPDQHLPTLCYFKRHHLGPSHLRPVATSPNAMPLPDGPETEPNLPPLLGAYLRLGGWVGDHTVVDPQLDTVHVFTGLAVCDIPKPRRDRLSLVARAATVAT